VTAPTPAGDGIGGLCDRLEEARKAALPERDRYPSDPWFEESTDDPGVIEAVWSDGARMAWLECEDFGQAPLIVAAVNALPQLLAAARERDRLRAAVEGLAEEYWRDTSLARYPEVRDWIATHAAAAVAAAAGEAT
jgi:hypothetical protein